MCFQSHLLPPVFCKMSVIDYLQEILIDVLYRETDLKISQRIVFFPPLSYHHTYLLLQRQPLLSETPCLSRNYQYFIFIVFNPNIFSICYTPVSQNCKVTKNIQILFCSHPFPQSHKFLSLGEISFATFCAVLWKYFVHIQANSLLVNRTVNMKYTVLCVLLCTLLSLF